MKFSVYNQIYTALFCYHFTYNTVDSRGNQSYFKKYVRKTMHLTTNKEREKGRKGIKSKGEQKVKKRKGKKRIKGKKERKKKKNINLAREFKT